MHQDFEFIFDEGILSPNQLRDLHREAIERMPQKRRLIKTCRHDTDDNFYPLQAPQTSLPDMCAKRWSRTLKAARSPRLS